MVDKNIKIEESTKFKIELPGLQKCTKMNFLEISTSREIHLVTLTTDQISLCMGVSHFFLLLYYSYSNLDQKFVNTIHTTMHIFKISNLCVNKHNLFVCFVDIVISNKFTNLCCRYVLMAEPDHIFVKPLPNLAHEKNPAAYPFFYIKPAENEKIIRKFYPKGSISNVDPIGNSPSIITKVH